MDKIKYAALSLVIASGIALGRTTPVHAAEVLTASPVADTIGPEAGSFFNDIGVGAFAGAAVGAWACGPAGAAVGTLAGAAAGAAVHILGFSDNAVYPQNALD